MNNAPSEVQLLGVYVPPLFLILVIGLMGTLAVTRLLNRFGGNRFFWHPPLAFIAMWVLASSLIGLIWIKP